MMYVWKLLLTVCIFLIGYRLVKFLDPEFSSASSRNKKVFVATMICLVITVFIEGNQNLLSCFFWSSLILAAYCDFCTTEIFDFVYLPACAAGGIALLFQNPNVTGLVVAELVIFILLQMTLFKRFYGFSDCIAVSVCVVWMASYGDMLIEYFFFMILIFLLLIVVQAFKRNIKRNGTLKQPVPMIPYIAAAMMLVQMSRWR